MCALRMLTVMALLAGLGGCRGEVGYQQGGANASGASGASNTGGGGSVSGSSVGSASIDGGAIAPGTVPLKRLTKVEFENTLRDWLASKLPPFDLPEDGREGGFDTVYSALQVSDIHLIAYQNIAETVVDELFTADPAGIKKNWCDYTTGGDACTNQIVTDFATRAWRRPMDKWGALGNGLSTYTDLASAGGPLAGHTADERLKAALQGVLVSPRFIYRFEFAADASGQLDTYSVASRLSSLLWNSAPDAELLAANLLDAQVLGQQFQRMQVVGQGASATFHPKFLRFLVRFPDMWLGLDQLAGTTRDATVFPTFSPTLAQDMRAETLDYFARFLGMGDNPQYPRHALTELLSASFGLVTPALADDYCSVDGVVAPCGIKGASGLVDLTKAASPRGGILTQASIMTLTGANARTSPVRRGRWVLEKLMCQAPPPPPPAAVAAVAKTQSDTRMISQRQRLAEHRVSPSCAACHNVMDPIGLGLENYDAIGRYRTRDESGMLIDASGSLPGGLSFQGARELANLLASDPRLPGCVVKQLATNAVGRLMDAPNDDALIAGMVMQAGAKTMTLHDALRGVVLSDLFRRRAPEVP
jgi:Protein of unknown function (DUF1588)/Protein of unknown function (DUF1592)/Protein of unknown function (DUF1587)/Protein of unknown function (DUF1595)/Protein of unknown function (DUF1585)